jgi:hypothetical protein
VEIPVLIEPIAGNGYRARGGEPLPLTAEGPTREAALASLREQVRARLRDGAEVVPLDVGVEPHPLAEFVGMFQDEPLLAPWKKAMADYRRKIDREPNKP